eukprot:Gregarina_sp_Poly_1__1815@NODE_1470_length_4059_cov_108_392034_g974_i0_p1_GENE_NODE_1470_length_4059_cov_108_392034_g974_i0NODE_1470_length_4059_cov_108_392034_g974_i0_p1_ORF_typecomplete_len392_score42_35_NODE_1470_length_4059_cov_108_392034_g974_i015692744
MSASHPVRGSTLWDSTATEVPPATSRPSRSQSWSRFQYHRSFESHVVEISSKLNAYFSNLGLVPYREFFPPSNSSNRALLNELRKGFSCRIWRNRSLVPSDENLAPVIWNNGASRIQIPVSAVSAANTMNLKDILNNKVPLRGFLHCMCLVDTSDSLAVYTPIVGGWVAASSEEQYKDREIKGMFSWRRLSTSAQKEVQYAFLLRLLIDALWWQASDGEEKDTTSDSARFVSIPIEDLPLFPVETLTILEEMGDVNASQHFDIEGQLFKHNLGKCPCSKFASSPDLSKSHLLIPTNRLRSYLTEQYGGRKRSTTNPISKAVFGGQPSYRTIQAVQIVREKIQSTLATAQRVHKRVSAEIAEPDQLVPNKRSRRITDEADIEQNILTLSDTS